MCIRDSTYISVLERRKEIGILRAIGASKRNISEVFNAETFSIGLCSGLMEMCIRDRASGRVIWKPLSFSRPEKFRLATGIWG